MLQRGGRRIDRVSSIVSLPQVVFRQGHHRAVLVQHVDTLHVGHRHRANLHIVRIEYGRRQLLRHMQCHTGVVGFGADVAMILLLVQDAAVVGAARKLGIAHVVLAVHLAEVGQQRDLALVTNLQHGIALAARTVGMTPMVAVPAAGGVLGEAVGKRVAVACGHQGLCGIGGMLIADKSVINAAIGFIAVIQAGATHRVEVHLRAVHLRRIAAGNRRVHLRGDGLPGGIVHRARLVAVGGANAQQVVARLGTEMGVLFAQVHVMETGEFDVLVAATLLGILLLHVLPGNELHLDQVVDAMGPQHFLADHQIAGSI